MDSSNPKFLVSNGRFKEKAILSVFDDTADDQIVFFLDHMGFLRGDIGFACFINPTVGPDHALPVYNGGIDDLLGFSNIID